MTLPDIALIVGLVLLTAWAAYEERHNPEKWATFRDDVKD